MMRTVNPLHGLGFGCKVKSVVSRRQPTRTLEPHLKQSQHNTRRKKVYEATVTGGKSVAIFECKRNGAKRYAHQLEGKPAGTLGSSFEGTLDSLLAILRAAHPDVALTVVMDKRPILAPQSTDGK